MLGNPLHLGEGNNYLDRNGDSKQYTVIDWDKKVTIQTPIGSKEDNDKAWEDSKKATMKQIMTFNPVYAGPKYAHLLKRGAEIERLEWNELAVEVVCQDSYDSYVLIKELEYNTERYNY